MTPKNKTENLLLYLAVFAGALAYAGLLNILGQHPGQHPINWGATLEAVIEQAVSLLPPLALTLGLPTIGKERTNWLAAQVGSPAATVALKIEKERQVEQSETPPPRPQFSFRGTPLTEKEAEEYWAWRTEQTASQMRLREPGKPHLSSMGLNASQQPSEQSEQPNSSTPNAALEHVREWSPPTQSPYQTRRPTQTDNHFLT